MTSKSDPIDTSALDPADTTPIGTDPVHLDDYRPSPRCRARHDGWTAERQRTFLTMLAETDCI